MQKGGGFEYKNISPPHHAYFQIKKAPVQKGFPTQLAGEKNCPEFFSALAEIN
jgi:hypothetical protein